MERELYHYAQLESRVVATYPQRHDDGLGAGVCSGVGGCGSISARRRPPTLIHHRPHR